jgi:hypothetical protein
LWGVVHTSQFSSAGVDENALTAGIDENALTACGSKHSRTSGMSSRNGRAAELDIILGMARPAAFLGLGAVPEYTH